MIRSLQWKVEVDQSHQQAATNATKIGSDLSASALGWTGLGGEKDKPPPRLKWFLARWVHFVLRQEPGTEGEVLLA